jgi:hypothetical protein
MGVVVSAANASVPVVGAFLALAVLYVLIVGFVAAVATLHRDAVRRADARKVLVILVSLVSVVKRVRR